ncbi:hypothetical protein H0A36_22415 [Endozoicomonas sp. SM1973]|uniref:Uncharacterized protein n=1 Tax=Spartinivicinus marinus TaxID=2994442 RepID=A0A853II40_9GAMM|nr:hypothetical protein [Spartinivicinus marinus]MCX4029075.1 hypothetical protein [Spartinivicinus marinus]NYZ68775.1 hypothetical protein [Spartinivicinus marinus]
MANTTWPTIAKSIQSLLDIYRYKELTLCQIIQSIEKKISTLKNEISIQEQEQQKLYSEIKQCINRIDKATSLEEIKNNKLNIKYFNNKIDNNSHQTNKLQQRLNEKNKELADVKQKKLAISRKIYKYELIYENQEAPFV